MNVQAEVKPDGSVDLVGKQGSTWRFVLEIKQSNNSPMNLTGYTARGQIRKFYNSRDVVKSFTCTIMNPATDGKIGVMLSATDTAAIKCGGTPKELTSTYVYDIEIESSEGEVTRVLQGKLYVDPEVTK